MPKKLTPQKMVAQSTETVEYTECISVEWYCSPNECPVYDSCIGKALGNVE